MSWPDGERYSCPLQSFVVSFLFCLFLDWRHTVSSKLYNTEVSSIFIEELVISRHARGALSRFRCNGHSPLLSSYLFRIYRIENFSCSACGHLSFHSTLSSYRLFVPLALLLRPLVQALESCTASGAPWSSAMPPSLGQKGSGNNNNIPGLLKICGNFMLTTRSLRQLHQCFIGKACKRTTFTSVVIVNLLVVHLKHHFGIFVAK